MTHVAAWFLYSIMIASLFGLAAVAGESALRASGRQGRWAWVAAMSLSLVLPFLAWAGLSLRSVPAVPDSAMITLTPLAITLSGEAVTAGLSLDDSLLALWVAAGSALLIYLALSWSSIVRARRHWRHGVVDGVPVMVTDGTGPAVWGIRHPRILLPEWALALESRVRRLMLLHEGEHVRAGDTRVVLMGLLMLAVAPWNVPLWWQFRRLQQSVELDCDARVLRRIPDARRYGALLLEVGRRRSAPVMAVALADPAGFLERRIRMISAKARNVSVRRIGGFAILALILVAVAVCTRDPMAAQEEEAPGVDLVAVEQIEAEPEFTPFTEPPRLQNGDEIQRLLERLYPPLLRDAGIGGRASVWFFLDVDGTVLKTQVARPSGYPALDQAALEVAGAMRFSPALNRDVPVRVWVSMPIRFTTTAGQPVDELQRDGSRNESPIADGLIPERELQLDAGQASRDPAVPAQTVRAAEVPVGEAVTSRADRAPGAVAAEPEPERVIPPRPDPTAPPPLENGVAGILTDAGDRVELPPVQDQRPDPSRGPAFTPFTTPPRLLNGADVQATLQKEYPPILRDAGIMGKSVVWLYIDDTGRVDRMQIAEQSDYPALDQAAVRVAATMRFSAAENKGKAVAVWVSIPISFTTK